MIMNAPPHLDDWTTALVWLLAEVTQTKPDMGSCDKHSLDQAFREIMRCHPLHDRFIASNAITEGELLVGLIQKATGTSRARKSLATALPKGVAVKVSGLTPKVRADLNLYGLNMLPETFQVELL